MSAQPNALRSRPQDMNERLFGETPSAMAMVAIRRRDPTFSLPDFMTDVQEDVRPVLLAYLGGDLDTLAHLCADEVVQRARGERKAFDALGVTPEFKVRLGAICWKMMGMVEGVNITSATQTL